MAMPDANHRCRFAIFVRLASAAARRRQRAGKLLHQHRLDELGNASANPVLDGIEPIIERQNLGGESRHNAVQERMSASIFRSSGSRHSAPGQVRPFRRGWRKRGSGHRQDR
jgi:hypothetical protein